MPRAARKVMTQSAGTPGGRLGYNVSDIRSAPPFTLTGGSGNLGRTPQGAMLSPTVGGSDAARP